MNCVRRLGLCGPLSRLMTRVVTREKRSLTVSHQSTNRSTRQSLVTLDVTAYRKSSSEDGRKMPTGVTVATGAKSWSAALVGTRLLPPRAKGPTLTVALASIESRKTCSSPSASSLACFTWAKMASVCGSFFGADSSPLFGIIAKIIELGRDGLGGGQFRVGVAELSEQLAAHFRCREPRIQACDAQLRVRLALTIDNGGDIAQ